MLDKSRIGQLYHLHANGNLMAGALLHSFSIPQSIRVAFRTPTMSPVPDLKSRRFRTITEISLFFLKMDTTRNALCSRRPCIEWQPVTILNRNHDCDRLRKIYCVTVKGKKSKASTRSLQPAICLLFEREGKAGARETTLGGKHPPLLRWTSDREVALLCSRRRQSLRAGFLSTPRATA